MCRKELPRVYELIDLIEDRAAPNAYFQNFESDFRVARQMRQVWRAREAELDKLDKKAWDFLKDEARPYLTQRDPRRGWSQLISTLNQARAYAHLQDIGCSNLRFIRRRSKKTPDLEADLNGGKILCEVKTIHISDSEASARRSGDPRMNSNQLAGEFFDKLRSHLEGAKRQMEAYEGSGCARRMVFVIINFDDSLARWKDEYYRQIDEFLAKNPVNGMEIVFYNQRTGFHPQLAMTHATVINE